MLLKPKYKPGWGPLFTFSLPVGDIRASDPVSYATGAHTATSLEKMWASTFNHWSGSQVALESTRGYAITTWLIYARLGAIRSAARFPFPGASRSNVSGDPAPDTSRQVTLGTSTCDAKLKFEEMRRMWNIFALLCNLHNFSQNALL